MIRCFLFIILTLVVISAKADTDTINSVTLSKATISAAVKFHGSCLRYKIPTRSCVWLSPTVGRNLTPV